jgi:pyruvate,water dikinase
MIAQYWLDRVQSSDRFQIGERLFYLSDLQQYGYPIIQGFIITAANIKDLATIFEEKQALNEAISACMAVQLEDRRNLQLVVQTTRKLIDNSSLSQDWLDNLLTSIQQFNIQHLILRPFLFFSEKQTPLSSNLAESYLEEPEYSFCQRKYLEKSIKNIIANLLSVNSLFYLRKIDANLNTLKLAIMIQPLYNAIASGNVWITQNQFIIESTWGLENSLIKGEVEPDIIRINRQTGEISETRLGHKNLSYRLNDFDEDNLQNWNCLFVDNLERKKSSLLSLDNLNTIKLISITKQLALTHENIFSFTWLLIEGEETDFYLTRIDLVNNNNKISQSLEPQVLLKGITASKGKITARVQIVNPENIPSLDNIEGKILVTHNFSSETIPLLQKAAGAIAEVGGMTSHAAIVARELEIPALIEVTDATLLLTNGQTILLDGDRGEISLIVKNPQNIISSNKSPVLVESTEQRPPIATKLMANLSQIKSIPKTIALPVDGIGLLRADLILMDCLSRGTQTQLIEMLTEAITQFAAAFHPRPLFYRSTDWILPQIDRLTSHFLQNLSIASRGTFNYLLDPTLFDLELEALIRVRNLGYYNLHLVLPFVRSLEEFEFCRRRVEQKGLMLSSNFQLGIVAEVPSTLLLLQQYIKAGVGVIAIGSNDLTQLLLGSDRERDRYASRFNATHPAVLEAFRQLIQQAKEANIPCSICGQAPVEHPEIIEKLIDWGITSISVEPSAIEQTYWEIARAEKRILLRK